VIQNDIQKSDNFLRGDSGVYFEVADDGRGPHLLGPHWMCDDAAKGSLQVFGCNYCSIAFFRVAAYFGCEQLSDFVRERSAQYYYARHIPDQVAD
jgi:hypothetical protein